MRVLILPGRNAQLSPKPSTALRERNRNIRSIRELGRREWHTHSGYSKRSMVENTTYRYKTIIGRSMRSRTLDGQRVEVQLVSKIRYMSFQTLTKRHIVVGEPLPEELRRPPGGR